MRASPAGEVLDAKRPVGFLVVVEVVLDRATGSRVLAAEVAVALAVPPACLGAQVRTEVVADRTCCQAVDLDESKRVDILDDHLIVQDAIEVVLVGHALVLLGRVLSRRRAQHFLQPGMGFRSTWRLCHRNRLAGGLSAFRLCQECGRTRTAAAHRTHRGGCLAALGVGFVLEGARCRLFGLALRRARRRHASFALLDHVRQLVADELSPRSRRRIVGTRAEVQALPQLPCAIAAAPAPCSMSSTPPPWWTRTLEKSAPKYWPIPCWMPGSSAAVTGDRIQRSDHRWLVPEPHAHRISFVPLAVPRPFASRHRPDCTPVIVPLALTFHC